MALGRFPLFSLAVIGSAGASCATLPISGDPAVAVQAVAETQPVGTANADAADDPAIWRNASDPANSLIIATDKRAGLYVYDLQGVQKSFLAAGLLNNVDLVELTDGRILVAASDRSDGLMAHIALSWLDTRSGQLSAIGRFEVGTGEAYGLCMAGPDPDGTVTAYSPLKSGAVYRTVFAQSENGWEASSSLLHKLATQPEGCVVDPRTATLYVGEEGAGIWAFDLDAGTQELVASIDNHQLVADVEGLALAPMGEKGGFLIASSQGDNAYALYKLPSMEPSGRFRITAGTFGATEETDGIDLELGDFGPQYPDGLFVAQDGINGDRAQNFKLVPWRRIKTALSKPN